MKITRVGDEAPEAYVLDVANDEGTPDPVDFQTVTEAEFRVLLPDEKTAATWTATISNVSANGLRLTHEYAEGGGDLPQRGMYRIRAWLTTPDGVRKSEPDEMPVRGEFETS